jgi:SAM-dependent methyltransferase
LAGEDNSKRQKDIFLQSEADAWYERNKEALAKRRYSEDEPVTAAVSRICELPEYTQEGRRIKILEVGCGEGGRLEWLANSYNAHVAGVDPSSAAIEAACKRGVDARVGTADRLSFEDSTFDCLIFGFCLYLCDIDDLFRIACEADRVLKPESWVVINDFFASASLVRDYHHRDGLYSHKMDYRRLFDWHPFYTCYSHLVVGHGGNEHLFTDDPQEWVSISILRKNAKAG